MERCAAELKATLRATAPLEQAALYHCTYCDGNHNEKDCPQRCVPDQPQSASGEYWTNERLQSVAKNMACSGGDIQAASGGALSAENIKLKIGSRFYDREPYSGAWDEPFNVACEVLNAALAAHDQKVRREVLEAINDVVRESAIYRPEGRSWITGPEEVLAAIRVALASVEKEK